MTPRQKHLRFLKTRKILAARMTPPTPMVREG